MKEVKVSINELVSLASYSVEKDIVPSVEELNSCFDELWADLYLDETFGMQEGLPCFIIRDNVRNSIRGCYVADKLDAKTKANIIDNLDTVIFDLLFDDAIEQVEAAANVPRAYITKLAISQDYRQLLKAICDFDVSLSDFQYSWLLILGEGRLDLLEL